MNFKDAPDTWLNELELIQPDKPTMVMEWWTGWFDYWGEKHHDWSPEEFEENLGKILDHGSSVNFYMFHGGTNFGWMNVRISKINQILYLYTQIYKYSNNLDMLMS